MSPTIVIQSPGQDPILVGEEVETLLVGRAAECDVVVEDPKVSGRHLRLRRLEGGGWVARDLESTQGTRRADGRRVLRTVLAFGDVLHLGGTTVTYLEHAPGTGPAPDAPLVGGTLDLKPLSPRAAAPAPAPAPIESAPPPPPPAEVPREREVRTRPVDARSMGRAVALVAVGLLLVAGVHFVLGPQAEEAARRARERSRLSEAIQRADISAETFAEEVEDYLADHPDAEARERLLAYLSGVRAVEAEHARVQSRLMQLTGGLTDLPESEVRAQLLELQRTLPMDEDLSRQALSALDLLERRHDAAEEAALEAVLQAADARVGRGDPAGALRRLAAFRYAWPAPSADALGRIRTAEDRAVAAADRLASDVIEVADGMPDELARRTALAVAWRGLAGTPQGERVAEALRFTRPTGASAGTPGASATPGSAATPAEPELDDSVLERAAEAERLAAGRLWREALAAFKVLIDESDPGPLQREWLARSDEVRHVLGLVEALGARASGDSSPRVKLSDGRAEVVQADDLGVELQRGDQKRRRAWPNVAPGDLLLLLKPPRPTPSQRLGLAVLAAGLSLRSEVVDALAPLLEKSPVEAEANALAARYLFGRGTPPEGGYRVYKGEIVDREGYERRLREERVAAFRQDAEGLLAKLAEERAFKKLERLKGMRDELDTRRKAALLAIFNEKHYPYPANKSSSQYQAVQKEIDRRVASAREIWDDPYKVVIARKGPLGRLLDKWDETMAMLRRADVDVSDYESRIAPYVAYVTGEPVTIREYFRNAGERKLHAYNQWVMETYNPGQDREATQPERQQTRITNDYRMLLGYAALVTPGPALYAAIDDENVVKVLGEGRIENLRPLRAVRIDDRLVQSARSHSLDMQRRGFFNHHAPANPATGEPRTSPFDRMKKAGYGGGGASENIAQGTTAPEQAHWMWIHSSGHHRNILSPWDDQGVGQAGKYWTQNFGAGGGGPARIVTPEAPPADNESKRSGRDASRDR